MAVITVTFSKRNHDVFAFTGDVLGIFKHDFRKGKNRQALWLCDLIMNGFYRIKNGPAFYTEFIFSRIVRSTFRTGEIKLVSAFATKLRIRWIARMAIWALHYCPPLLMVVLSELRRRKLVILKITYIICYIVSISLALKIREGGDMDLIVGFMAKWIRRSTGCSDVVRWLFAENLTY